LTSANQQLGVFTQSCRSCHNAGNSAGGLNLDDYTQARNAAGNIVARMNNATRPMPTSGLLSQEKREIVNIWLSSGTPQN
jgi:mono/diheme cytochrome c family protein